MNAAVAVLPFEHFHLYTFASELVKGKRVLDIAAREGDGARILAETAQSVIGMDPDEAVTQDAAEKHQRDNLQFVTGSVLNLPFEPYKDFDAIIFFDAIEDGTDPARAITEVKHLLAPGGFLMISAPEASLENSFPASRFGPEQFYPLIESRFATVERLVQRTQGASSIERTGGTTQDVRHNCAAVHRLIAIASDGTLPKIEESIMPPPDTSVLQSKEKAIRDLLDMKAYLAETTKRQEKQIAGHKHTIASLEEAFAWHTDQIKSITKTREYLEHEIEELRRTIASDKQSLDWRAAQVQSLEEGIDWQSSQLQEIKEGLAWRTSQVENLEKEKRELAVLLRETSRRLTETSRQLELIHASTGWKFISRVRSIRSRLFPEGSLRDRALHRILHMLNGE